MKRFILLLVALLTLMTAKAQQKEIRISCLGASITEGYGTSKPWSQNAYPGQLAQLLGPGYHVENFGRGGCTMIKKGEMPYWNYEQLQQALKSAPDIVFIDLGGNDAKLVHRIHKDDFVGDACELVRMMQALPSHPRIILMTAIPGFTTDSVQIWDTAIVRDINPRIIEAARQLKIEVLDMHPLLENHPELVPDDIHPNDVGAGIMARKMAWYLQTFPRKPSEEMTIDGVPSTGDAKMLLSSVLLNGAVFTSQQLEVKVQFYTPEIVRVYKTPVGEPFDKQSLVVLAQPDGNFTIDKRQEGDVTMLTSPCLQVRVNIQTGGIDFYSADGRHLLKNKDYGTSFLPKHGMYEVRESFLVEPDEPVYGIGQVMDGHFSRRHQTHHLQNENMFTYSPYFLSPKGYAVFLDNYSISDYSDTPQDLSFRSLGHCDDYYFIYGGTADGVISGVRHLTGHSPMLPLWAYGFFQSRERYATQNESLDVLRRYRQLHVPIDCIIQDWRYWPQWNGTDSLWNSQTFDPDYFPTPKKWGDEIHRLHAKLLIVTWPGLGAHTPQHHELDSLGMLINFKTFPDQSGAKPYDVFNPQARDIFWKYLDRGVFSAVGNDGWWLDSTEPDHIDRQESDYDLPTYIGPYRGVKNLFSYMHNKGIAEHQKAQRQDKRVVILTRSGFVGQQRFGSNTWSGDVYSTWRDLTNQIPAALNFTLMGLPYWNSDIGGFWANEWRDKGGCRNPEFQELYVRWTQFGLFCPMMRSHGTGLPREIFQFGERGNWCFDAQERAICLRYRLLPYIYSTAWDVSANDGTFMRPLLMDFASDRRTYEIGNEYLFGRQLLVAPVTRYQATTWDTYLPAGTKWWNFWTNQQVDGGQTLCVPVTKSDLPVFVKAGTILPFGPLVEYATEKRWDDLEVRIYPGADGTFTLYEDEADNYNYEHGAYTTITFQWDDADRRLTISNRNGRFKGMLKKRKFQIILVGPESGIGDQPMRPDKTISYSGKQVSVKL